MVGNIWLNLAVSNDHHDCIGSFHSEVVNANKSIMVGQQLNLILTVVDTSLYVLVICV